MSSDLNCHSALGHTFVDHSPYPHLCPLWLSRTICVLFWLYRNELERKYLIILEYMGSESRYVQVLSKFLTPNPCTSTNTLNCVLKYSTRGDHFDVVAGFERGR